MINYLAITDSYAG